MRIVFVTHCFPFLPHTFIVQEMIELRRRGHDLMILSAKRPSDEVVQPAVHEHGLLDLTHYMTDHRPLLNRLAWRAERRILALRGRRALTRMGRRELAVISELVRRGGFQVIHSAFGNGPATVAMQLSRETGLPYTFESHAYDLFVDFPFAREKLASAARIFTISEHNRAHLERDLGCAPDKIVVKRVTFDKRRCDALISAEEEEGLVVSACRLHPIKGLPHILEAVRLVADRHPKLRYVVLGDGPQRSDLERRARELGIAGRVELRGGVGNPEVLKTLAKCSVSILASEIAPDGDRDGIPTAMIEAMCLRKPVIGTRVSGIPELVDHGVDGLLADEADPHALAAHLDRLLGDADLRRSMGARAREKIDRMFDIDANMDLLEDGLQRAISEAHAA